MYDLCVLDCTLRDGGFVNDWMFGQSAIMNIARRLDHAGIEIIELGMINDSRTYSKDCTNVPNASNFNDLFANYDFLDKYIKVGMIILGDCCIDNICDCKDTILDGIRIVYKNTDVERGLAYAEQLREKGYTIFLQPASITDYSVEELKQMLKKANAISPYGIYIVDTYGLVSKKQLLEYFDIFNEILDEKVWVGYHAHNNFNTANANVMELVDYNKNRKLIIDATIYGMGKNAGNAHTEVVCQYLNTEKSRSYDIAQFLEIINMNILPIKKQFSWGYELKQFVSASNKCHPKYVNYLMKKNTLTMMAINAILSRISEKAKTVYIEDEIKKLYEQYLLCDMNDASFVTQLTADLKGKAVMLLCPGKSVNTEKDKVQRYIKDNDCTVVSLNYLPEDYFVDYLFVSNVKRYDQVLTLLQGQSNKPKLILTSNIHEKPDCYDYMVSFDSVLCPNKQVSTNAAIVMFNLLIRIGIEKVGIAGFDGYAKKDGNYVNDYLTFEQELDQENLNSIIKAEINKISDKLTLNYITKSLYNS